MLWWLSHGEGRDAVTWCGWDKLEKGRNYWKSRLRCQVYGVRGVSWWLCVCFIWLDMTTPPWCREKVMVYLFYFTYYQLVFTLSTSVLVSRSMRERKQLAGERRKPVGLLCWQCCLCLSFAQMRVSAGQCVMMCARLWEEVCAGLVEGVIDPFTIGYRQHFCMSSTFSIATLYK